MNDEAILLNAVKDHVNDTAESLKLWVLQLGLDKPVVPPTVNFNAPDAPAPVVINDPTPVTVNVDMAPVADAIARMAEVMAEFAEMLSQLVQVLSEQQAPRVDVHPAVTVGAPSVTVRAPQPPARTKRTLRITHSDGTESVVSED